MPYYVAFDSWVVAKPYPLHLPKAIAQHRLHVREVPRLRHSSLPLTNEKAVLRRPLGCLDDLFDQATNTLALGGSKAGERLVEQQDARPGGECQRHFEQPLAAIGQ